LLLHSIKELFFLNFTLGTSKIIIFTIPAKKFEIFFPAVLFRLFPSPSSRNHYLKSNPSTNLYRLKAGAKVCINFKPAK